MKNNDSERCTIPRIPKILFESGKVTSADGSRLDTVELIRKDQPLISLITPDEAFNVLPSKLERGEHTSLAKDGNTLFTDVDGYPQLTVSTQKGVETFTVTMVPLCTISTNKMAASITLYPHVRGAQKLNPTLLQEILAESEIRFGFSSDHLQRLLHKCKESQSIIFQHTFANGLLPMNGKDSFLRFAIEVGPLPGKMLGNGKIDFRERKMFVGVTKGQTIATRIPATDGTPGIDITGSKIEQLPGRSIAVTVSDDATYDENTGLITASHGGILSLVNENSIKVCAKQVISGNIDYNTGNIESQDAVEIGGTILPGFKVRTHGDLLLGGNARSAKIKCLGSLVIKGGILGEKCRVKVQGDADVSFMEQGRLRAKGTVVIRKQAYYARIMADGDIRCEERSQIMAGELMCAGSISVGAVGSENSPAALLAAGISPGKYLRYLKMKSQLQDIMAELKLLTQRFGLKKKIEERKSLEEAIDNLTKDMKKLNLVPTTSAVGRDSEKKYLQNISITVKGTMAAGTMLQIGNSTKTLRRPRRNTCFTIDEYSDLFVEGDI